MNYKGLKDDIIFMLAGGRCKVNPTKFQNDMSVIRSNDYVMHRELASGKGFADIELITRKNVDSPALVIELNTIRMPILPSARFIVSNIRSWYRNIPITSYW